MIKTRWIKANGDEEIHETEHNPDFVNMQDFCGGHIELVHVLYEGKRCTMFVHGEGMLIGLPINVTATDVYHEAVVKPTCEKKGVLYIPSHYAQIHGPAVLFDREYRE